ncbi:MAG: DUF3667 domain-containing protein [Flavobacteriales bacterium]|nr:DUF3667 domain-containing protein [Flavobacteriales bacterium]
MEKHLRHLPKINRGDNCLNCGHDLHDDDNFCPRCGQLNDKRRLSFSDILKETLGDFLAYDSRLQNSIKPLLTNPGQLSIDYIKGERASHIHPIRLYLVVSFIFFLLISFNSWKEDVYADVNPTTEEELINNDSLTTTNSLSISNIEDTDLDENEFNLSYNTDGESDNDKDWVSLLNLDNSKIDSTLINEANNQLGKLIFLALADISQNGERSTNAFFEKYNIEDGHINRLIYSKTKTYSNVTINSFSDTFFRKLPLIVFFFLPLFAIFLNLVHYKQDILYFEHLIFAFHNQSVYFILMIISEFASIFFTEYGSLFTNTTTAIFLIYLYISLKHFYSYKSTLKAASMFTLINIVFLIMAGLYLITSILTTIVLY